MNAVGSDSYCEDSRSHIKEELWSLIISKEMLDFMPAFYGKKLLKLLRFCFQKDHFEHQVPQDSCVRKILEEVNRGLWTHSTMRIIAEWGKKKGIGAQRLLM